LLPHPSPRLLLLHWLRSGPWLAPPRGEVMHDFFPQMID
jgi:hypothetical protein